MTSRTRTLGPREFIFFIALISAMSAMAIDIVLPAFAEIREDFGLEADSTAPALTITLFLLGLGVGNLFAGPLADAIGRKKLLVASMITYGLAAIVSASAPSLGLLLLARFMWGFAAAGPRILSQAIVRDRWAGDAMARVMTMVQAGFLIGPIIAPVLGRGLTGLGSWRYVMMFGALLAAVTLLWGTRLEETLAVEDRRPFDPATVLNGYRIVMANPISRGWIITVTLGFGAFFSFLGSTELVFDDVYDRAGWFVPYFSVVSACFALVAIGSSRYLRSHTGTQLVWRAGLAMVAASLTLLVMTLASDGRPSFWVFAVVFSIANASHQALFPTANSLALEPMGQLAGTAAAVLGVTIAIGGASLAAIIDRAIDGTITPIAIGYTVYSSAGLLMQWRTRQSMASVTG